MLINEFAEKVKNAAVEILGDEYNVEIHENIKLNDTKFWSVNITDKKYNISPIIYLEYFHDKYEKGTTFGEIMNELMGLYKKCMIDTNVDLSYLTDFESVRDDICVRLCNRERNSEMLMDVPFIEFLDLAVIFYIEMNDENIGDGHILVTNKYMKNWGISCKELMRAALDNLDNKKELKTLSMSDFYEKYLKKKIEDRCGGVAGGFAGIPTELIDDYMWILTNESANYGASAMICAEKLKEFTEMKDSNVFIIPSSVHELILIPDVFSNIDSYEWKMQVDDIKQMIFYVNRHELAPNDFLSDNLYYFDKEEQQVRIV